MNLAQASDVKPLRVNAGLLVWAAALCCAAPAAAAPPAALVGEPLAAWQQVLQRQDNAKRPFLLIDKRAARLWVFDAAGKAVADTAVLLGQARGDDSVPGIGDKALADVKPNERTTPAGRFIAEPGLNGGGEDVIWVDYDAAVSMHRVRALVAAERRLQRLASSTAKDNRISWGCINVPAAFFDRHLVPLVSRKNRSQHPVVYVLPETRPLISLFVPAGPTKGR